MFATTMDSGFRRNDDEMTHYGIVGTLAVMALLCCTRVEAQVQTVRAPEVTLRLSSDTILLGEPVWVLVTARNTTGVALRWNPGDYCPGLVAPVSAVVPGAAPGNDAPAVCTYGTPPSSCHVGGSTTVLAPAASATWRYLLEGGFHFVSAGTYDVRITSHPGKIFPFSGDTVAHSPIVEVTQTRVLVVRPRNDAALLTREIQLAADYERALLSVDDRASTSAEREAMYREVLNLRQLRHGLAVHPAPGMEEVFQQWLQRSNDFEDDAILGLKNLNSVASRAALAVIAATPSKPNSYTQSQATTALSEMGDSQYYALMIRHLTSPHELLRRAAVWGVGRLGGDAGVAVLLDMARKERGSVMSNDAVTVLGHTASRVAVQGLIDLIVSRDGGKPIEADWSLFVLTHHRLPAMSTLRSPEQTQMEWRRWWETIGKNAPVYTPFQCAPRIPGRG